MKLLTVALLAATFMPAPRAAAAEAIVLRAGANLVPVGVDGAHRVYIVDASGRAFVMALDGRTLASWSIGLAAPVRAAVLPGGGMIAVGPGGGAVVRWDWHGDEVSRWSLPAAPVLSIAVDPHGSLLVDDPSATTRGLMQRVGLDGRRLGWVPGGVGAAAVTSAGRQWIAAGGVVEQFDPDGGPRASIGNDCPIGGDAGPCRQGIFDPAGAPLSLAATDDGGALVADPGTNRLHRLGPSGSLELTCIDPLRGDHLSSVAVDGRTVIIGGASAVYRTQLQPSTRGCRGEPRAALHARVHDDRLSLSLPRRRRVSVTLWPLRLLDCAAHGLVPSIAETRCAVTGAAHALHTRTLGKGTATLALGRLTPGRWIAVVHAGNAIDRVRFRITGGA